MGWEYVALEWRTGYPEQDTTFIDERREMLDRGWTEHLRAGWSQERMPRRLAGGICIMRRLKPVRDPTVDTAKARKGGDVGWEYVALTWETEGLAEDNILLVAGRAALMSQGWTEYIRAGRTPILCGGACIMRRPVAAIVSDEPRMWTKADILELFNAWSDARGRAFDCQP